MKYLKKVKPKLKSRTRHPVVIKHFNEFFANIVPSSKFSPNGKFATNIKTSKMKLFAKISNC